MRVTNNMIMSNTKININGNKTNVNTLNNQMTSQKKISKPSDDPVIAIRALRLRSSLSQINQYYEKNIPDAEAWLDVTETSLTNMKKLLTTIHTQCDAGANGTPTEEDRKTILKQLQSLSDQIYSEGDADYAGRTVFTGYKTNSTLTFQADSKETYNISEYLSADKIEEYNYSYGNVKTPTAADVAAKTAPGTPENTTLHRLRLSYDNITDITGGKISYSYTDTATGQMTTKELNVTTVTTSDLEASSYAIADNDIVFNKDTGEFLMGKTLASNLKSFGATVSINYDKTGFSKGELRPENYFDCTNNTDAANPIQYTNFENGKRVRQDIEYTIASNQTLVVNTQASTVFNSDIARDLDNLTSIVQSAIDAHSVVDNIKEMKGLSQYSSKDDQEYLESCLAAAQKQADYADHQLQTVFNRGLTKFEGYMSDVNLAITDVGSKGQQLDITKNRMSNQQQTVEALKSDNEDKDLSEIIIDYTSSYTAYQASLQAAAKLERQTLLDYL